MNWVQDPEDSLNYEYMGFAKELLRLTDERIDEVYEEYEERGLIDAIARIYWDTFWEIKRYNGTSAQWPWLAEYCLFSRVKKHIEQKLGTTLVAIPETKFIYKFVDDESAPNYTLYHNAFLEDKVKGRKIQPDVSFFKDDDLLFTIDVKVAVGDSNAFIGALKKLIDTGEKYSCKVYIVSAAPKLTFSVDKVQKQFNEFKNRVEGKVVGPIGGSLETKMKELGDQLYTLENCFEECIDTKI